MSENIIDSFLKKYIDRSFNNLSTEKDIIHLSDEIIEYVENSKNKRLKELEEESDANRIIC